MLKQTHSKLRDMSTTESVLWVELIFPAVQSIFGSGARARCDQNVAACQSGTVDLTLKNDSCVQDPANIHEYIKQIELIPLTILILITNLLVLVFIVANKRFHTPTYIFIASLAIADLFVGFVSIVTVATKASERSQQLCLARISITIAAISASVWSLTCVAVDRYVAITRALLYGIIMTKRRTLIGITWSWGVSLVVGFLPMLGWKEPETSYQYYCSFIYVLPKYYLMTVFIISAVIPLTIMFVTYIVIFKTARFHIKQIQAIERMHLDRRHSSLFGISSRNIRSVKTFAAILGCVVITWLPLIISTMVVLFSTRQDCDVMDVIGTHLLVLGFSNSFLNPLIYAIGSQDFRNKVCHVIQSRFSPSDSQVFPGGPSK